MQISPTRYISIYSPERYLGKLHYIRTSKMKLTTKACRITRRKPNIKSCRKKKSQDAARVASCPARIYVCIYTRNRNYICESKRGVRTWSGKKAATSINPESFTLPLLPRLTRLNSRARCRRYIASDVEAPPYITAYFASRDFWPFRFGVSNAIFHFSINQTRFVSLNNCRGFAAVDSYT